jgi:hypothetical protein
MEKSMDNPKNNPKLPTGSGEKAEPKVMQRWSAARKREIVLRLLRGESLDMISRGGFKFGRKHRSHALIEVVDGKDVQTIVRGGAGAN